MAARDASGIESCPQAPVFESGGEAHAYRRELKRRAARAGAEFGLLTSWDSIVNVLLPRREACLLGLTRAEREGAREFLLNKRDAPLLPLAEAAPGQLPVFSQYTCAATHADLPLPCLSDYRRSLAGLWVGECIHPQTHPEAVPPWETRRPGAVFRGGATGGGVTAETNPRLRLCALSATWWRDRRRKSLLNAALTSWNPRHKRGADGVVRVIDPATAAPPLTREDVGRRNFLTMRQQAQWRYYVLLDGNVGASRLGELAEFRFTVLMCASALPQVELHSGLVPWVHFVPLRADLADLEERIRWCRANDAAAARIALALATRLVPCTTSSAATEERLCRRLSALPAVSEEAPEAALLHVWRRSRAAVYCLVVGNKVALFAPFANADFRNDWSEDMTTSPRNLGDFLDLAAARFGPEDVIQDPSRWWDSGSLVCNVMPREIWGCAMLPELARLVQRAAAAVDVGPRGRPSQVRQGRDGEDE